MCNHACVLSPGHLGQTWAQVRMRENPAMAAKDLIRGLNRKQDRLEWLPVCCMRWAPENLKTTVFWEGPQKTVKNVIFSPPQQIRHPMPCNTLAAIQRDSGQRSLGTVNSARFGALACVLWVSYSLGYP